jgi:hypothetical protein
VKTILPREFKSEGELLSWMLTHAAELRGRVVHMVVLHDDEWSPNRCVCKPSFELREATVENVVEGARAQAEWIRRSSS